MSSLRPQTDPYPDLAGVDLDALAEVQKRVLWIATRMIDVANSRPKGAVKVGGHQASSASMVSIMTALWFGHLDGADKVAVKPHASPVYHAIKYLTGELGPEWLTTLRQRGGLQAYPSRTKDPDVADFSTGSVGLGAVAPLFSALTRRYVDSRFGPSKRARFISLVGDAELDEGNVWEAIADHATSGLGDFTLVVDLNRQSLDRVVPDVQATRLAAFFADAGWHVTEAKYGRRLQALIDTTDGEALRRHIDLMPNEAYQQLFSFGAERFRPHLLAGADPAVVRLTDSIDDRSLFDAITDLGGHDLGLLLRRYRECDAVTDRPSVVFAYTIKGWGLPMAGDPMNHSALLSREEIDRLRSDCALDPANEWQRFDPGSRAGQLCATAGAAINNPPRTTRPTLPVPPSAGPAVRRGQVSSQEAFGRTLSRLADVDGVRERIVTVAPDVSVSTSLGGWINKVGVYSHEERDDHGGAERLLRWAPAPSGQHIELGISEMNLFMLLGQLGLSHDHHGEQLLPIGTVYDPFVLRGLDAFVYGAYNDARFVIAGTPAGVSLAPEGGAHQSTITASVGLELPNVTYAEPCFATEVDWLLCDALERLGGLDGGSTYLRLSTKPIDQAPFDEAIDRYGEDRLRSMVLAGGYLLAEFEGSGPDAVTLVTTGTMVPETLVAASHLADEGVGSVVIHLTCPDRIYRSWQQRHRIAARSAMATQGSDHLTGLVPQQARRWPIVSVHDAASHALAWLGSALGTAQIALGVDRFGESGTIEDLYDINEISAGHIVNAGLAALELRSNATAGSS